MIIKDFAQYVNEALLFPAPKADKGKKGEKQEAKSASSKYMTLKDF